MAMNFTGFKAKDNSDKGVDIYLHGTIIDDQNKTFMRWMGINEGYVLPCDIREQLAMYKGRPLNVYINSPGGEVFSGIAIANMLARHDAPVTAYVDGMAASMASVIFLSCTNRIMPANALLMIHRPSGTFAGNADEMLKAATVLETIGKSMLAAYIAAAKKGVTAETIKADMISEKWYTAEDAAKVFDIQVSGNKEGLQMAACTGLMDSFKNIPEALKKATKMAPTAADAVKNKQKAYVLSVLSK